MVSNSSKSEPEEESDTQSVESGGYKYEVQPNDTTGLSLQWLKLKDVL